jgi:cation-transporting P-type ATPase 13A2
LVVRDVESIEYGRSLSTVFGEPAKRYAMAYDEDDDPVLEDLRILDYRYMRFCFHPPKDKFILSNSWKDPAWTDVKAIRAGIDGDEKENRELVFGKNLIEIKQKTIPQLLIDEVLLPTLCLPIQCLQKLGFSPFLCLSDREFDTLVCRRVLLLCRLYFPYICRQHHDHSPRDSFG